MQQQNRLPVMLPMWHLIAVIGLVRVGLVVLAFLALTVLPSVMLPLWILLAFIGLVLVGLVFLLVKLKTRTRAATGK